MKAASCFYISSHFKHEMAWIHQKLLPPMSMITTEKTFSHMVLADTLPNPTVVSDVQV